MSVFTDSHFCSLHSELVGASCRMPTPTAISAVPPGGRRLRQVTHMPTIMLSRTLNFYSDINILTPPDGLPVPRDPAAGMPVASCHQPYLQYSITLFGHDQHMRTVSCVDIVYPIYTCGTAVHRSAGQLSCASSATESDSRDASGTRPPSISADSVCQHMPTAPASSPVRQVPRNPTAGRRPAISEAPLGEPPLVWCPALRPWRWQGSCRRGGQGCGREGDHLIVRVMIGV